MQNHYIDTRDGFIKENQFNLSRNELSEISGTINHVITYPSLLEDDIRRGECNNIPNTKIEIQLRNNILNEIVTAKGY